MHCFNATNKLMNRVNCSGKYFYSNFILKSSARLACPINLFNKDPGELPETMSYKTITKLDCIV